ncbi:MAG: bifunctional phosphopantothenoylcysteine decarboxylase/phosphopantothenate--cysteine ligase CoaBC [Calditrichaeota bacterium]|nr:bifunctional phosphopantothenoylcysteine decarboxylase/phosphopantothenate--cysteine ligase CoaBC [Calditrichota bacterium]MCB9367811.1 bifunctional phosphopantothenoylcysteine decarboxylase/phosphopantothenate--cysteine ligase CoaBC [Calditrichota bacterium]
MKSNRRPDRDARYSGELGGRRILLGVTGGIAAYKAVEVARLLMKAGAKVQVVMTSAATKFVAPLSFETVTGRDVFVEMFPEHGKESPWHTELSSWAEIVVVAPATADHIGRIACGLGDDLLTTTLLAYERRRVICPSMNPRMWANPAVQENLNTLRTRGFRIVNPEDGEMARPGEDLGIGRLAEPETIFAEVKHLLSAPQDLRGVKVLVTGGRTEESWDPVRVLTNRASGRMGFALAEEARERGADVSLISGPSEVVPPSGVRLTRITTAHQMAEAVKREFHYCNILLMSAAVSDYTFGQTAQNKIKKGDPDPEINLVPTEDILRGISKNKGNRVIVGFALETENVLDNALRKLREKHLDIVVANNPLAKGSGFQVETNQVFIIHRNGSVQDLPLQSKREVAREILNAVMELYRNPLPEPDVEPDLELDFEPELPDAMEEEHGLVNLEGLDIEEGTETSKPEAPKHDKKKSKHKKKKKDKERVAAPQNGHAPSAPVDTAAPASEEQPLVAESPAEAPAQQAATAAKKKSRRGGRRVRERRERLAALAAQQSGQTQTAAPVEARPAEVSPDPKVTETKSTPVEAAAPAKKAAKKTRKKAVKKTPEEVAEAAEKKAAKKTAKKTSTKTTKAKAAKKKSAKKSADAEVAETVE